MKVAVSLFLVVTMTVCVNSKGLSKYFNYSYLYTLVMKYHCVGETKDKKSILKRPKIFHGRNLHNIFCSNDVHYRYQK